MEQVNPYASPTSALVMENQEYGAPAVFSFSSRIGRLRYLARITIAMLLVYLVLGLTIGLAALDNAGVTAGPAALLFALSGITQVVFTIMFGVQRLHDMNRSAWFILLLLVPFVNIAIGLYMLLGAGTDGPNDYGPPPPPNSLAVRLAGIVLPLIFVTGILAAIAIPAWTDYQARASQAAP